MAFHNVRLPVDIAYGSMGGPMRRTEVAVLGSGFEERNAVWAHSRRKYNAGYGLRTRDSIHTLIAFFEARNGRLNSFRMKDHGDFKSCPPLQAVTMLDQQIGIGDGFTTQFQITKDYGDAAATYTRNIVLVRSTTLLVALDGVAEGGYALGAQTGIIQFNSAPVVGAVIKAGYEFDVPVRFDTDHLNINLAAWEAGEIPDVPIIEVRLT